LFISGPSSKSWILKIVLPLVLGVVIIVTASVIGFIWYKRCRLHQQELDIALKVLK
jgi:hypothetical protein